MKAQLEARIKVKMGATLDWHCGNSVANIVAHICFPRFPLTYHFATLVNFQKCCVHFPQCKERTQFEMQVQVRVWFPCRCKMFFRKSSLMTPQNYWLKPFFSLQNDTPFSFPTNQKVSFWGNWQTVVTFSLNRCSMCTLPQKLLKVLKRVLVTFSSVVPAFRPLFLINEPSFLGVFRCFWAFSQKYSSLLHPPSKEKFWK